MSEWADVADLVIKIVGVVGGGVAFMRGIREWQESQRWKRAERLDHYVAELATNDELRFATKVLDWEAATVQFATGGEIKYGSDDVRRALRVHWDHEGSTEYPHPQDRIRDALDALLTFFVRLEHEITSNLVDEVPALDHFAYWLFRLRTMNEHAKDRDDVAQTRAAILAYIRAYSDADAMESLFQRAETRPIYKQLEHHIARKVVRTDGTPIALLPPGGATILIQSASAQQRKPVE